MNPHNYNVNKVNHAFTVLNQLLIRTKTKSSDLDIDENIEEVNKCLTELLNMNIKDITDSPLDHFVQGITASSMMNYSNLDLFAELLYECGLLLYKRTEKEMSKRLFNRSLGIYQYLLKAEEDFTYERHIKIKKLKEILLQ